METAQITDLYQASYFLLSGCELTGIECLPTGGAVSCRLSFRGPALADLTQSWWDKQATVNLWAFRSAYAQINSYVHQAKKSYDQTQRLRASTGGDRPFGVSKETADQGLAKGEA